jgi:ubiquinone/menaquinone biosynthesis C-methylase UbiE
MHWYLTVLRDLEKRDAVMDELNRVLKPEGRLALSDQHLKEEEIV